MEMEQDHAQALLNFVRSAEALQGKLAQEIINAHLFFYGTMLSIFIMMFLLFVGSARSLQATSRFNVEQVRERKGAMYSIAFLFLLLSIWPFYKLGEGFAFPRVIVLKELISIVGLE